MNAATRLVAQLGATDASERVKLLETNFANCLVSNFRFVGIS